MTEDSRLTREAVEPLLRWLDPDRARAEEKYAQIRAQLLEFFESKECRGTEHLVDETVARVIRRRRKLGANPECAEVIFQKAARTTLRDYRKQWAVTPEALERLLKWLGSDSEEAGGKYNHIHAVLSAIFRREGLAAAESLADEAIRRVTMRLPELDKNYQGDPVKYFVKVARYICLEQSRIGESLRSASEEYGRSKARLSIETDQAESELTPERICFYRCLRQLPQFDRDLLLAYYGAGARERISVRKEIARMLGITKGALRVRRYRAQTELNDCIARCLKGSNR